MKPPNPADTDRSAARETRRAEALRLNLRRRKMTDAGSGAAEPVAGDADRGRAEPGD